MSDWNINTDIYSIMDSVSNLQKRYIEDESDTTLSLGVFGFIADTESKKIQTATIMAGQLGNEMFGSRALLTKNVLAHATYNGISDINATPAKITVTLCIKISDIDTYLNTDNEFFIDSLCPIFIDSYEFHLDYDVKIKKVKVREGGYSYSAQYVTTDENDQKVINPLSDITNPYLRQPFTVNIDNESYIGIQATIRQCSIEEIQDSMVSDSIIENKSYTFDFDNQLADFRIVVTDNEQETMLTPYLYGSTVDPEDTYCWYLFTAEDTIRVTFDSKSYIPGLNSSIYIKTYTTLGSAGNFEYLSIDQTSEGLYVEMESDKYNYKSIMTYLVAVTDSADGADKKTKEELQKLIPKAAMSRGSITTETDLNNYFNLINTEENRLVMQKKTDNQLHRIWYGYFLLKDDTGSIIPTNTINIKVDITSPYISQSTDGRYIIPAGTYLRYDPILGYAELYNEALIYEEYSKEYYDCGYYFYTTVYNMVIDLDPLYAAYYLTICNDESYFLYDYVNEDCDVQFIANRFHFQRKLITDQSDYNMSFGIAQSILNSSTPLIYTETIEVVDEKGDIIEKEVTTVNLKVVLVLYRDDAPYRWMECEYDEASSTPTKGIYYFNSTITTDDTMDDKNYIKVIGLNEVGSTSALYGYVDENTAASIYILAKIESDSSTEYARKDLDDIAPGYEDFTVTNIYSCINGLNFFANYTNVTNTRMYETDDLNVYTVSGVPVVGRHYIRSNTEASYFIEALKEKKAYIDYCLELIENSMSVDFKFFNTYGDSKTYMLENKVTPIGNININMTFKLSLKDNTDVTTPDDIVKSIKAYIEDLNDIGDLHIPNLITDIINAYEDRINFIEYVSFNTYDTDDQHIILTTPDEEFVVPEFINVRNVIDEETLELVPDIELRLV